MRDNRHPIRSTGPVDSILRPCLLAPIRIQREETADQIVSACRTSIGDELRSVTRFTSSSVEQLYLRADLDGSADLVGSADIERLGLLVQTDYRGTELGEYLFTIRVF